MPSSSPADLDAVRRQLEHHHQAHLLGFWDELSGDERAQLLEDIGRINLPAVDRLIDSHVRSDAPFPLPKEIRAPQPYPATPDTALADRYDEARKRGISLIRENRVAAFTVAGGQGTRLGFDGPKGAYEISPVKNKPLFQLFAEFIRGTNQRYGSDLHWYIMTSPQNDSETRAFFADRNHFGLRPDHVHFFEQGVMPVFAPDGRILLDQKHRVSFSPDGHGGSLLALRRSGALDEMSSAGIEFISYIQVDNPLVQMIDPLFIGLHVLDDSEMSSKSIPKVDDLEKVGNFVVGDGRLQVIEYSDLPEELAHARDEQGHRQFDAGSIAIHILSRSFVERLTADEESFGLPWHRAVKKMPYIDRTGKRVEPDSPNAVKLESFIFDAIPLARKPMLLETVRTEEFSPVKNATGVDSAQTARRDMNRRAAVWLETAGVAVPRREDGEPDGVFEISPLFALDAAHLRERLVEPPQMTAGQTHVWE
jgi:UDP-N-acetylglucosamine/UDP-N-acetylgalactosamine diphosphorylase